MVRPKTVRTPEEEAAYQEARRAANRERNRRQRAMYPERLRLSKRVDKQRRRQNDPGYRVMENFQRQVRRSLAAAKGRFQQETVDIYTQEDTTTTPAAAAPRAASWVTKGCTVAMSADVTRRWDLSCSKQTQATVATGTTGTQCDLGLCISSSCQTAKEFPVLEVDEAQGGAQSERDGASRGGADLAGKSGHGVCTHRPHTANERISLMDSKTVQSGGKLHSCLSCHQNHHQASAHGEVCTAKAPCSCRKPTKKPTICRKTDCEKGSLDVRGRGPHGKKPYACSACGKSFARRSHLVTHERVHSGERPYVCHICEKCFASSSNLGTHQRLHSEKPYVCGICCKRFAQKIALATHRKLHSGERPYVCGICQTSFSYKSGLVIHGRVHSGERPFKCTVCLHAFARKSDLNNHERVHSGERPFRCSFCPLSYTRKNHRDIHERLHSRERPFKCSVCSHGFTRKCDLDYHERVHSEPERPFV